MLSPEEAGNPASHQAYMKILPKITKMFATALIFQGFENKSILSLEIAMQICLLPS